MLGAIPFPFLTPPSFIKFRCQATTASGVMSRTFLEPSSGRMYDSENPNLLIRSAHPQVFHKTPQAPAGALHGP